MSVFPMKRGLYVSKLRGDPKREGDYYHTIASNRVELKVFAYGCIKTIILVYLKHTFYLL